MYAKRGRRLVPNQPSSPLPERLPDRERLLRQAELIISQVLRGGVLLSAGIILAGAILFYLRYFSVVGSPERATAFPHTLAAVGQGLVQGDPLAIIALGLLLLLATPVVRVAVSIVAFGLERDWRYVVITSIVLLILLTSFWLGKGGA
jgi:uncharacterized membrane protein